MSDRLPLFDLSRQHRNLRSEFDAAFREVADSGRFVLGPNVQAFEREAAAYIGVRHAVGLANGTDALLLSLRALDVGPGDEVLLPAFTFVSTAEVVLHVGAKPVYADIDPETLCLVPPKKLGKRVKAVIPVHLFGHPAPVDFRVPVIEDGAQSIGAKWNGRKTLSLGDIAATSFYPTKNLGAWGDGGMIFTDSDRLAQKIRILRDHGWERRYYPVLAGYNSRLDEIQAAILRVKLRHLDRWNAERQAAAKRYDELLKGVVKTPSVAPGCTHVYHLYCIRTRRRAHLIETLDAEGIDSAVYYPVPVPKTAAFRAPGRFPVAERVSKEILAIPFFPGITPDEQKRVAGVIRSAL